MESERRAELIERYRAGVGEVESALEGAGDFELDAEQPRDDEWTPRKVVHHLADSETNSYLRVRKLLAEDGAAIQAYDEAEFARRLHYDRPIEASLAVFRAVRQATSELLDRLRARGLGPLGDPQRTGRLLDGRLAADLRGPRVRSRRADPPRPGTSGAVAPGSYFLPAALRAFPRSAA